MEAAYCAWNTNFFGTRNTRCEVFTSDVEGEKIEEIDRNELEYASENENAVLDSDNSLKNCTAPLGVTGSAVLLWLPPPVAVSQEPKNPSLKDENNGCVSFINIYPSSSNGLKNHLNLNRGCEMEQKCLVNLISNGHMPALEALPSGSLVSVYDVAVPSKLLVSLKSQAKVDNFCQNIIESFCIILSKEQNFSSKKTNFQVVFQVQNTGCYGDILQNVFHNEDTNQKPTSRKIQERSQRGSTYDEDDLQCDYTEEATWSVSDLTVTGPHTYHAAYVTPIVKTLKNVKNEQNCPKSLFYLAGKTLQHETVGFSIDLKHCQIPEFQLIVKTGNLLLSVDSNWPLRLSVELPSHLQLAYDGNMYHWNIGNTLYFIAKAQSDHKVENSKTHIKKILDHSASVDSGIGSDELHCKNWLSFDMLELEMDDIFGDYGSSLNSNDFLELFGQKLLLGNTLLQSDIFDALKTPLSCAITDQKPICDTIAPVAETKIRTNEVAFSPSFEISQTFEKIHVAVSCSNIESKSVEIYGESSTMIGISFVEVHRAVRQHIYISSVDPYSHCSPVKIKREFGFENCKKTNSEGLKALKNVVASLEKVLISLVKSSPASWNAVWAGPKGKLAKIILSTRTQALPKLVKNAEPLRIEQQSTGNTVSENLIPADESHLQDGQHQPEESISKVGEVSDSLKKEAPEATSQNEPEGKVVNSNKKKKLGNLVVPVEVSGDDGERTTDCEVDDNEAVKSPASLFDSKEKIEVKENEHEESSTVKRLSKCTETNSNRYRRSSECVIDGSVSEARKSFAYRPRSILKRRGRSYSESHVGSLEECLGEELLGKYGSVEEALVVEYGCFEGLREECGWDEEDDDEAFGRSEELESSVGSKKNVRFNDVSQTHLFMSKASILNQIANDDKRAMRMKMKESKKKQRNEKRMARRSGSYSGSPRQSFDSSYRGNSGYGSQDEGVTTEESDGGELVTSSSGETTDNTTTEDETDNEKPISGRPIMEPSVLILSKKNKKLTSRKRGRKCNKKRVELTNNMIFQLDMEA